MAKQAKSHPPPLGVVVLPELLPQKLHEEDAVPAGQLFVAMIIGEGGQGLRVCGSLSRETGGSMERGGGGTSRRLWGRQCADANMTR